MSQQIFVVMNCEACQQLQQQCAGAMHKSCESDSRHIWVYPYCSCEVLGGLCFVEGNISQEPAVKPSQDLAANKFWISAVLPPLPWHSSMSAPPAIGEPVFNLHESVLKTLAPSISLRAVFARL